MATLIVDATVESIASTVKTDSKAPSLNQFITDVTLHVHRVIKGQSGSERILVSQALGEYGGLRINSEEYALMEKGKRYVLFLVPESAARGAALRIASTSSTTTPSRHSIIDEFVGLFDIDGAKVRVSRGLTGSWRAHYENMTPAELIAEAERLANPAAR